MMMGGQADQPVMTLTDAAGWFERRFGRRPNAATVWRWAIKGVKGVRLRTISLGRYRYTTERALERFVDETSSASPAVHASTSGVSKVLPSRGEKSFTDREVAAARRRREAEREKAKQFLRRNLGSSRPAKKVPG